MTRVRTSWLVFIAIVLILIGLIGAFWIYTDKLKYVDTHAGRFYNPEPSSLKRYALQEAISVDTPITVRIIATGGDIHVGASTSNQVVLNLVVPYKPKKLDISMMQRDGNTIIIDSKAIWTNFTGNVSQPVFDIDIQVPAGTSVEIRNTIGDITLDADVTKVDIDASFGTLEIPATHIERLDATYTVGGNILGNAPHDSNIIMNAGNIELYVDRAGSHTMRVTRGDIALTLRKSLNVTATQSAPNGTFYSQLTTANQSSPDVYLYLNTKVGNITLIPQ